MFLEHFWSMFFVLTFIRWKTAKMLNQENVEMKIVEMKTVEFETSFFSHEVFFTN